MKPLKNLIEKAKQQVDELTKKAEDSLKEDIERKKKIAELKPRLMIMSLKLKMQKNLLLKVIK